ncbi:MAG: DNA translocase FtsK 4TM domain-containing protein [Microthrixaceae bacterium]
MATKQTSKRKAPARKSTRSTRSTGSTRSSGRTVAAPSRGQRVAEGVSLAFDGHGHDMWGLACIALAIVSAIGIYAGSAGIVGSAVATAIGSVVGVAKFIAPPAIAALGIWLIRGPIDAEELAAADPDLVVAHTRTAARRVIGGVILVLSILGLIHIAVDPPPLSTSPDAFKDAGGYVGAIGGDGLVRLIGTPGAVAVLALLVILGLTLCIGLPFRDLFPILGRTLSPAVAGGSRSFSNLFRIGAEPSDVELFDYEADFDDEDEPQPKAKPRKKAAAKAGADGAGGTAVQPKPQEPTIVLPTVNAGTTVEQLEIELSPLRPDSIWKLPALSLLKRTSAKPPDTGPIQKRGIQLEAALAEHGVTTRLSGMVVGPTITRYELELGQGVKVNQVVNLSKDIAYAMASPDVRIIAPIPGKHAVGVEVPNQKRELVRVGDILCSQEAQKAKTPLAVAVGRDIEGNSVLVDLAKMPHILIAGQTGAGKSSCINSIMTSVLMRATPDDVRLILVDPKRVELTQYNRVPHLLTQVVTNPKKAANALAWAVAEMERRYELLEEVGSRDLASYNERFDRGELQPGLGEVDKEYQRLPLILIVVDELADLMMVAARDVEESINRIAAKARAVGLHLVIATQRPSVNVITGVIKANIPARFAFTVASATDSKVIMNHGGAERLVGKGDLLFLDPAAPSAERIQGCFVEEAEVQAVVKVWRDQVTEVSYVEEVVGDANLAAVAPPPGAGGSGGSGDDDDELLAQARDLVVRSQLGSTSMLQRKLKVGFARAGRIMDLLEDQGVVGPSQGSKSREVLMTVEELDSFSDVQ